MYELKVGDIIKIKTGGKIREVTITDIMLEAFVESEGKLDWKTTIRFKYGENPPYISDKKFANSFIEAYNNAVSEMNSI